MPGNAVPSIKQFANPFGSSARMLRACGSVKMIMLHAVLPENEKRVAERLKGLIVAAWLDVGRSRHDRVDIRVPSEVDILHIIEDILVMIDSNNPRALPEVANISSDRIDVETMIGFLVAVLTTLGVSISGRTTGGSYAAVDNVVDETRESLVGGANDPSGDMARLQSDNPERFAWDHVLIDESQDCRESERDFLQALHGHRRFNLAYKVDQLVRRQVAGDSNSGRPKSERVVQRLETSLRMLPNVATFPSSRIARQLRATTKDPAFPRGIVERTAARSLAATLTPPVHAQ